MKKVFYILYIFIFGSFLYLICFKSDETKDDTLQSKPIADSSRLAKPEKKIEKPKIIFNLPNLRSNNTHCIKDSLIIKDNIKSFSKKICYWGDSDSTVYLENQTTLSHKYQSPGIKTVQVVCDSFMPASYRFLVYCDRPDSFEFSIHAPDRPNISQDTLMFNKDLKLYFESTDEDTKWLIDGRPYNANTQITFKRHRTIEVTYISGKTYNDCICDSTMKLTFVKKKR